MDLAPITLRGTHVVLEPALLAPDTVIDELVAACPPGLLGMFSTNSSEPSTPDAARAWLDTARERHRAGTWVTFLVRSVASGELLGATCLLDIDPDVPRAEVGGTWYTPSAQGTHVNPEAKLLLLRYAFETLGCRAVWLRTSHRNARSQRAIGALGARFDGVLRNAARQLDGELRDTHVFSVVDGEWPEVRRRLEARLGASEPAAAERHHGASPPEVRRAVLEDAAALSKFRVDNRDFHAPFDPVLGDAYYTEADERMRLGADIARGTRHTLLAWEGERVVGLATIANINRGVFLSANCGYKVAEDVQGRGIATQLVGAVCELARGELGLHRLEAGTLLDNVASQRVLARTGFERIGVARRYLCIAGEWRDHLIHARTFDEVAPPVA